MTNKNEEAKDPLAEAAPAEHAEDAALRSAALAALSARVISVEEIAEEVGARDISTVARALNTARDVLAAARLRRTKAGAAFRAAILAARPAGILTVEEMAEVVGKPRNYIDCVWSTAKNTPKGKRTKAADAQPTDEERKAAADALAKVTRERAESMSVERAARAERNRLVAAVYASKVLGPSDIGTEVGLDRNHVLRVARRAGIKPVHRPVTQNQYTAKS